MNYLLKLEDKNISNKKDKVIIPIFDYDKYKGWAGGLIKINEFDYRIIDVCPVKVNEMPDGYRGRKTFIIRPRIIAKKLKRPELNIEHIIAEYKDILKNANPGDLDAKVFIKEFIKILEDLKEEV